MMSSEAMQGPPVPPSVRQQQAPNPVRDFVSAGAEQPQPQYDSMQFVAGRLNEIAGMFSDVAKVLAVDNPALLPLVKKIVEGASVLQSEVLKAMPQGGQNTLPTQAQMPEEENAANAVSSA